jgi:hypothetical protein
LISTGEAVGYLFHVLDLRELQRLVAHSAGRPAMLEHYLTQRWQLLVQRNSALIRSQFLR